MTASTKPYVLLVEDTPSLARVYLQYLRDEPIELEHLDTGAKALAALEERTPQAILLDLKLPDMDGMDILKRVQSDKLPTAVVVVTAHGSVNIAVAAMRGGAYDFLVKPFNADRLLVTLRNALERQRLAETVETFREEFARDSYFGFIGSSLPMQAVYRIIDSAAASKATVFITGESGTGKEVCAEAIHSKSPRREKAFVALNCGAIPRELMESEIFGHVKGAFTGASNDRDGAATLADGGTLFLDEICEMEPALQVKLLRFVQTGTYQKVGGSKTDKTDIRFICATNRDPLNAVEQGDFREDLYYRLNVIPIALPPLNERGEDLIDIARRFLVAFSHEENKRFSRFAPDVEDTFRAYEWPGNVRQVQNVVRNIVVLNDAEVVTIDMLPSPLREIAAGDATKKTVEPAAVEPMEEAGRHTGESPSPDEILPLWQLERDAIERAIEICAGNIPKAAACLGISASSIYRKRQAWKTEGAS
jgi:DNA-binding NtrC family response regulator